MGIGSGGSFGGSSGGDSGFSSGGRFDDNLPRRHHRYPYDDDPFYTTAYNYNNDQPRPSRGSSSGGRPASCRSSSAVFFSFFTVFGSIWVLIGIFKTDQPLMSLNYSRLISANSIFVKQIEIQNLRDPGPIVYSFSKKPALRDFVNYNETHDDQVEFMSHKEWRYWLNAGSTIQLSYDVRGLSQDYLVLAFIRGTQGFEDWKRAPNSRAKTKNWYRIHGSGVKYLTVDRDDDYYIAYGNLNSQDMEVVSELNIHSTVYSVEGADTKTVLTSDMESITMELSLFHANSLLLTTPSEPLDGVDIWEVAVIYSTRWITYGVIWGAIAAILVVFCGLEAGGHIFRRTREELPLLAPQDEPTAPSYIASNSSSVSIPHPDEHGGSPRDEHRLCTICLDATKDCFFDPCGHSCTCYTCGQRIQEGNSGLCPLCRQPIRAVRKIFDS